MQQAEHRIASDELASSLQFPLRSPGITGVLLLGITSDSRSVLLQLGCRGGVSAVFGNTNVTTAVWASCPIANLLLW